MKAVELYPFQREGVRLIRDFDGRALLADQVGLGKTVQALYYAWKYLPEDPPGPVVVVVPAHLKINWAREAAKHLGLRVEVLSGRQCPPDKQPPLDPNQIYVINYEVLVPPHWPARTAPAPDSWTAFLGRLKPRLLIADEGQNLRDAYSARTRAVRWLARRIPRVLILTATPLANKPPSIWPLLNILRPDLYPSQFDFAQRYTHAKKHWWGWDFKGARDLDLLHAELREHLMIRRRKEDVLQDLPLVTVDVTPVDVDLREYRRAEEDFVAWLEDTGRGSPSAALQAEELSRMGHLKRLAGELKVDAALRWGRDLLEATGGKLLLGAIHYAVTGPLVEGFRHMGMSPALVDGRMGHEEKQRRFDRFNLDPKCRVMVGNVQAAGTGWSCFSTSDAALIELPWTAVEVDQFVGRIYGIERGLPGTAARVAVLVAADTIDEDLCDTLEKKFSWSAEAVDGHPGVGAFDVHKQVKNKLKQRVLARKEGR